MEWTSEAYLVSLGSAHLLLRSDSLRPQCFVRMTEQADVAWIATKRGQLIRLKLNQPFKVRRLGNVEGEY